MHRNNLFFRSFVWGLILFLTGACHRSTTVTGRPAVSAPPTLFTSMPSSYTHIDFINQLNFDPQFNIFTYRNFYDGGGVALGDINNDGLIDIFFTSNMGANRLYLNQGNFQFQDITGKAGIVKKGNWSTGVTMADVNGDGLLDIYVCNSGNIAGDNRHNQLFINNGDLTFTDRAEEYGVADGGYSIHAAFFDYDHDGDLDLFLLRNASKPISSFNLQRNERDIRDSLGGDKLYRNDNGHFTDVSKEAGIYGSVIGFGLGVTIGDVNNDGWPDIYVSNDFFERDYLYINQKNGTFREELEDRMQSISNASMGADMADINNDGLPDLFVTEMLPEKEDRLKTNTSFENWDKYQLDLKYDYYRQFSRNTLQLNNGNNTFSEISRLAGVHATDWSWGALLADLDNDGWKDIFVASGVYRDLTNQDYVQYISNREVMKDIVGNKNVDYKKLIDLIPSNPVPNHAFHNNGDLTFSNKAAAWGLGRPGFSNGSAYGDLDNDGDLDLVVNCLNMPPFIYRNESIQQHPENKFLKVILQGEGQNRFGIGAKVTVYHDHTIGYQEEMPTRGFESSVDPRLNFGLGTTAGIDSVVVDWPDGRRSVLNGLRPDQSLTVRQADAKIRTRTPAAPRKTLFRQSPVNYGIDFVHKENVFNDFEQNRLIFHMLSTDGPRVTKGDVNGDGLEDIYICGAKGQPAALYIQTSPGKFKSTNKVLLDRDKGSEDTDCLFFDADGDGDLDLFVCSGGDEFSPNSTDLISRLYLNDGKGNFTKSLQVLPSATVFESSSCVTAADYDGDGDMDLFVGVRLKPFAYGYPCKGYILQNNGKGVFTDVTGQVAPELLQAGMITDAKWFDYDRDGKPDLVIAGEYTPIRVFHNEDGHLKEVTKQLGLDKTNGWWNRLEIADVNNDGYPDIIAGNHGLNSRFRASMEKPVSLYAGDFNGNGMIEQVICCYNGDSSYPVPLRQDLVSVVPSLKKKYLNYKDYKEQTVTDIFSEETLSRAVRLDAYELRSCVLLNNTGRTANDGDGLSGKPEFIIKPLPVQAQFSPVYGILVKDLDGDGHPDILLGGNFFQAKPETGIYDASYGLLLKGDGKGNFQPVDARKSGIVVKGQIKDITDMKIGKRQILLFALNDAAPRFFEYNK